MHRKSFVWHFLCLFLFYSILTYPILYLIHYKLVVSVALVLNKSFFHFWHCILIFPKSTRGVFVYEALLWMCTWSTFIMSLIDPIGRSESHWRSSRRKTGHCLSVCTCHFADRQLSVCPPTLLVTSQSAQRPFPLTPAEESVTDWGLRLLLGAQSLFLLFSPPSLISLVVSIYHNKEHLSSLLLTFAWNYNNSDTYLLSITASTSTTFTSFQLVSNQRTLQRNQITASVGVPHPTCHFSDCRLSVCLLLYLSLLRQHKGQFCWLLLKRRSLQL